MERSNVLVVGGTGRTGARLVERLRTDPRLNVFVLARDTKKAVQVFGLDEMIPGGTREKGTLELIPGDLLNLDDWAHRLDDIDIIVSAVSCGVRTDPLALLGLRPTPANMPYSVDFQGIAQLADAAKLHGVRRFVAVTSASTGTPWSLAGIFLNMMCCMSIKWKFFGEQAIRQSGIEYVVIRPFGLFDTPAGEDTACGIEFSQGQTQGTRRRIAREDVAKLCHEAVYASRSNITFECWSTKNHKCALPWPQLRQEIPASVADVNHDVAVSLALAGVGGSAILASVGTSKAFRKISKLLRR